MKKLISTKRLLETPIFTVSDNWLLDPEGHKIRRIMVEHGGSTVVLPVDEQGRVLMVRQYRFPVKEYLWELPAGVIDPGETALQAAKRELREETGFKARRWKKLVKFYPSPGFQEETMTIFLASDLAAGESNTGHDEHLRLKWFEPEWIEGQIRRGRFHDAKTIIGMYVWRGLPQ